VRKLHIEFLITNHAGDIQDILNAALQSSLKECASLCNDGNDSVDLHERFRHDPHAFGSWSLKRRLVMSRPSSVSGTHHQPHDTTAYKVKDGQNLWDIAQKQVKANDPKLSGQALLTATAKYLDKVEADNKWLQNRPGGYNMIYGQHAGPGHHQDTIYLPDLKHPKSSTNLPPTPGGWPRPRPPLG